MKAAALSVRDPAGNIFAIRVQPSVFWLFITPGESKSRD